MDNGVSKAPNERWLHYTRKGVVPAPLTVGEVIQRLLGSVWHSYFGREVQEELKPSMKHGVAT